MSVYACVCTCTTTYVDHVKNKKNLYEILAQFLLQPCTRHHHKYTESLPSVMYIPYELRNLALLMYLILSQYKGPLYHHMYKTTAANLGIIHLQKLI